MRKPIVLDGCGSSELGECATWSERDRLFFWCDIDGCSIHSFDPRPDVANAHRSWRLPGRPGCFTLTFNPRKLVCGVERRVLLLDLDSGETELLSELPIDPGARINDGRCDREGRFVFGLKFETREPGHDAGWFCCDNTYRPAALRIPAARIANGLAFSPAGREIYWCDSLDGRIWRASYGLDAAVSGESVFADGRARAGVPDGSTVDSDGTLWNARWGDGCVVHYDLDGSEKEVFQIPALQPSCPSLAPDGRLFVTSARAEMSPEQLAIDGHAGAVFLVETASKGISESVFIL